jgi:hypothetical protein
MRERIAFDAHVHTTASGDATNELGETLGLLQQRFKDGRPVGIAVVDHNIIDPTILHIMEMAMPIVVGEEITTGAENPNGKKNEIVGLFLRESIKPGKSMWETIYQIKQQGGVVVIPHPYDLWRHGAGEEWSEWIINVCLHEKIPVAVEVFNARASRGSNQKALELWEKFKERGVLGVAGSDAHERGEIGRAHLVMPFFRTKEEFLQALAEAEIQGKCNGFATAGHRLINRVLLVMLRMKHK